MPKTNLSRNTSMKLVVFEAYILGGRWGLRRLSYSSGSKRLGLPGIRTVKRASLQYPNGALCAVPQIVKSRPEVKTLNNMRCHLDAKIEAPQDTGRSTQQMLCPEPDRYAGLVSLYQVVGPQ